MACPAWKRCWLVKKIPVPPELIEQVAVVSNVPTKEETEESNALIWVAVLLVLGTLVPMATWWVFSR